MSSPVAAGPTIGDAFGELLRAAHAEQSGLARPASSGGSRPVFEIIERDDGLIDATYAGKYLAVPPQWPGFEQRALTRIEGRTLDIGAGAGRLALALQEQGLPVVALDTSPGAVEVAKLRGVRETVCATVDTYARGGARFDTFVLFGNNVGLLESRRRAPVLLTVLASMARPGARLVAQGTDPYGTESAVHMSYHARNRAAGRMGGQLRLRVRHRELATEWFDYLLCSTTELADLVASSSWRIEEIDDTDSPTYVATLRLA
jgi:SAM-dependent methyltransferase